MVATIFMFVNLVLSVISGIFILMATMKDLKQTLPIACVWVVSSTGAPSNAGISIAGTIAVISGQCIFFGVGVWYLHIRERRWITLIQTVGLLVMVANRSNCCCPRPYFSLKHLVDHRCHSRIREKKIGALGSCSLFCFFYYLSFRQSKSCVVCNSANQYRDECRLTRYIGEMKVPSPVSDDSINLARDQK